MNLHEAWESGLIQAVGGAIGAVLAWIFEWPQKFWKKLMSWRATRKFERAAMSDMIHKFPTFLALVEGIGRQVNQDGGGSLRDVVDRVNEAMEGQKTEIAALRRDTALSTAIARFQSDVSDEITFHATPDGRNNYASAGYQRLLGVSARELLDYGWKNYIAQDEVVAYLADQETCIRERRRFQRRVNLVRSDRSKVLVDVMIIPYPDDRSQELQSLMGQIKPVEA